MLSNGFFPKKATFQALSRGMLTLALLQAGDGGIQIDRGIAFLDKCRDCNGGEPTHFDGAMNNPNGLAKGDGE